MTRQECVMFLERLKKLFPRATMTVDELDILVSRVRRYDYDIAVEALKEHKYQRGSFRNPVAKELVQLARKMQEKVATASLSGLRFDSESCAPTIVRHRVRQYCEAKGRTCSNQHVSEDYIDWVMETAQRLAANDHMKPYYDVFLLEVAGSLPHIVDREQCDQICSSLKELLGCG